MHVVCTLRSLGDNELCGVNWRGEGTYTTEGIEALCDMLKVNATLTSLRWLELHTSQSIMLVPAVTAR